MFNRNYPQDFKQHYEAAPIVEINSDEDPVVMTIRKDENGKYFKVGTTILRRV